MDYKEIIVFSTVVGKIVDRKNVRPFEDYFSGSSIFFFFTVHYQ